MQRHGFIHRGGRPLPAHLRSPRRERHVPEAWNPMDLVNKSTVQIVSASGLGSAEQLVANLRLR